MRLAIAAAATVGVLLVGFFGAPLVPVLAGAAAAGTWSWWRARPGLARRPR